MEKNIPRELSSRSNPTSRSIREDEPFRMVFASFAITGKISFSRPEKWGSYQFLKRGNRMKKFVNSRCMYCFMFSFKVVSL